MASEAHLIRRILDGHTEDFAYFLDRYGHEVFVLVSRLVPRREDAEEVTEDVFVKAFRRLDDFEFRSSFSTWICRIAYTTAVSWVRRRRVEYVSIDDDERISDRQVDEVLDDESLAAELAEALKMLRPEEMALVNLFYYDDRSLQDIAYILDIEPGTVATRLHRVRRKLYKILKENGSKSK